MADKIETGRLSAFIVHQAVSGIAFNNARGNAAESFRADWQELLPSEPQGASCPANDNAARPVRIADRAVIPRAWYRQRDLTPVELITAFVGQAKEEVQIYSQHLSNGQEGNDHRTYFDPSVIKAFVTAAKADVRIYIVISEHVDYAWASKHDLLVALRSFIGKTVFIRYRRPRTWNGKSRHVMNANFMVVDGAFIRYEQNHNSSTAVGLYDEEAGRALRECFIDLWNLSTEGLNGPPSKQIHIESRLIKNENKTPQFLVCKEFDGITQHIPPNIRQDDISLRDEFAEVISFTLSHHFESNVCYVVSQKDCNILLRKSEPTPIATPPVNLAHR